MKKITLHVTIIIFMICVLHLVLPLHRKPQHDSLQYIAVLFLMILQISLKAQICTCSCHTLDDESSGRGRNRQTLPCTLRK
jgi:hypothetical protein